MSKNAALIAEIKHEAISTRKMLERVPMDKFGWKPHEKSMTLGRLTQHVIDIMNWLEFTAKQDELDLGGNFERPKDAVTNEELLSRFNANLDNAIKALESTSDEKMGENWTLRSGDHVIFTMPRAVVFRSFCLNHFIHHRGQLSVYLRLLDVPLPNIYGPSADEQ